MPFGGIRHADRYTLDCLPSAFRSQGFSPSQRLDPGTPSWLLFQATSAHRLHGSPELLPSRSASVPLGTSCSPAIECSMTCRASRHIRGRRDIHSASRADHQRHTAGDPGSRALLRPGVRHSVRRVNVTRSRCSPDLFPLRGVPTPPLGVSPPLVHLAACHLRKGARRRCFRVSIRSGLAATPEGAASASIRFATSYASCRNGLRRVTPGRLESDTLQILQAGSGMHQSPVSIRFRC
jgi:hypothetical protein